MRIWVQVFSARERNPNSHDALEQYLRSVAEPGVESEVHGKSVRTGLRARTWEGERTASWSACGTLQLH
jgi:hypothetical protein